MPRYFFDLLDGEHVTVDEVGLELESDQMARNTAASVLADLAREAGDVGVSRSVLITLRDESGNALLEVAVPVPADQPRAMLSRMIPSWHPLMR